MASTKQASTSEATGLAGLVARGRAKLENRRRERAASGSSTP